MGSVAVTQDIEDTKGCGRLGEPACRYEDPESPGSVMRLATPADNDQLLRLFSDIPMRGQLAISTDRGPDFFALYAMQKADVECWVYDQGGDIKGLGAIVRRDGWYDGEPCEVAYLGDLRAHPSIKGALSRFYGRIFEDFVARTGCQHFYTGVLASNAGALKALTGDAHHRAAQPKYDLLRPYDAVQVQFSRRPRGEAKGSLTVRTATPQDIPDIVVHLDADHRQRPFGYRFADGEFEHRLAHWTGFSLDSTYLVIDGTGALRGVCTAWDAETEKRYRVVAYRGQLRWARWLYNAGAAVMRYPALPPVGECFRYFYLANLSIPDGDPAVLDAMLRAVFEDFRRSGCHFFMVYMEDGDPLNAGLSAFSTRRLAFRLFTVTSAGRASAAAPGGTCGFETALA